MIFGICGSLRAKSLNRMALLALQTKAPELVIWEGLAQIPPFNPDWEDQPNDAIVEFRRLLRSSAAVVIASPEYAHGVTGILKNALDWTVGSGEFMQKPTVMINCSHSSTMANLALRETLSVMEAEVLPFSLPLFSHGTTVEGILENEALSATLGEIAAILSERGRPACPPEASV